MKNQCGETSSTELSVEKDRYLKCLGKPKLFVSHCKVGVGLQMHTKVMDAQSILLFLSSFKKRDLTLCL